MNPAPDKVRENRLRRAAERQGLRLVKSRRRDPRALDFGRWMVVDAATGLAVAGVTPREFSLSIDQAERYLMRDDSQESPSSDLDRPGR